MRVCSCPILTRDAFDLADGYGCHCREMSLEISLKIAKRSYPNCLGKEDSVTKNRSCACKAHQCPRISFSDALDIKNNGFRPRYCLTVLCCLFGAVVGSSAKREMFRKRPKCRWQFIKEAPYNESRMKQIYKRDAKKLKHSNWLVVNVVVYTPYCSSPIAAVKRRVKFLS